MIKAFLSGRSAHCVCAGPENESSAYVNAAYRESKFNPSNLLARRTWSKADLELR
jgi:hypothetical protein